MLQETHRKAQEAMALQLECTAQAQALFGRIVKTEGVDVKQKEPEDAVDPTQRRPTVRSTIFTWR